MLHKFRFLSSISGVVLGAAIVVLLSGCDGQAQANALRLTKADQPTSPTPPAAVAVAALVPQPVGSANLTWDPATNNTLTVDVSLMGLAPADPASYNSADYPAEIGNGNCQQPGKALYPLKPISADKSGAGSSTTSVKGVAGGIPAKGWYLAVRSPAAGNQGALLSCAPILNPNPSTTQKQSTKTLLRGLVHQHGGEAAVGEAHMSLSGTTLMVTVDLVGLNPGSKHDAHIHSGSCQKQGPVVHPLQTITADANGRAHVVTTIQNVKSIPGNWYVNIHNGTDLTSQAGFQPIACGDVLAKGK